MTTQVLKYEVIDNGGTPFTVTVHGGQRQLTPAPSLEDFKAAFTRFEPPNRILDIVRLGPTEYVRQVLHPELVEVKKTDNGESVCELREPVRVFVGFSPPCASTALSGGIWPFGDGNTILVHIKDLEYLWAGMEVFKFQALAPIVEFVSLLGNNSVPYPYAKDENGNYYFMIEQCVVLHRGDRPKMDLPETDPYQWFYDNYSAPASALLPWAADRKQIISFNSNPAARYVQFSTFNPTLVDVTMEEYLQLSHALEQKLGMQAFSGYQLVHSRLE